MFVYRLKWLISIQILLKDSLDFGVPREEKELIQDIVNNIVNFTSGKNLNGKLLSQIFSKIFAL